MRGASSTSMSAVTTPTPSTPPTIPATILGLRIERFYHGGMADSSFDIVSKVDHMETQNALGQAQKEIAQRYDFKNVGASIEFSGEKILIKANAEERAKAVLDVFEQKLIKRGISLRSLDAGEPFASGKESASRRP